MIPIHHPDLAAEHTLPDTTPPEALKEYTDRGWTEGIAPWRTHIDVGYPPPPPIVAAEIQRTGTLQLDPNHATVDEVNAYLATADDTERARVLKAEKKGKARKSILEPAAK